MCHAYSSSEFVQVPLVQQGGKGFPFPVQKGYLRLRPEGLNYFCNDCQKISNGIENEDVCFYCKSENIEHKPTWHVHSCIINPSDKKEKQVMMRDNFGKIYEKLLKPHLE